jgi:predicted Fe-Mo cluster-binding NifX family protein
MDQARIVVPCDTRAGLESELCQHFGRCATFAVVEVEGGAIVSCGHADNPHQGQHARGAVPQLCRDLGADVLLCGGIGGGAIAHFEQSGITVSARHSGTVREVVSGYLGGESNAPSPCRHDHPQSCGGHES